MIQDSGESPFVDQTKLLTDTFEINFESDLVSCISVLESSKIFEDPIKQILRGHILPKKEQILDMLHLVRELRVMAISDTKEKVLCHGDIWGGNLIRHEDGLYFVDWESVILAPPEFDFIGYIGTEFNVFLNAYEKHIGETTTMSVDLLRFYSYRHHLRNLTNWLMNILYRNTEETQNDNDLNMILHHCMDRWDSIEPNLKSVAAILQKRKEILM